MHPRLRTLHQVFCSSAQVGTCSVSLTWPSGQVPLQLRVSVGLGKALPVPFWPVLSQCSLDKGWGKAICLCQGAALVETPSSCQGVFQSSVWMDREHYLNEILPSLGCPPFSYNSSFQIAVSRNKPHA